MYAVNLYKDDARHLRNDAEGVALQLLTSTEVSLQMHHATLYKAGRQHLHCRLRAGQVLHDLKPISTFTHI